MADSRSLRLSERRAAGPSLQLQEQKLHNGFHPFYNFPLWNELTLVCVFLRAFVHVCVCAAEARRERESERGL